MANNRNRGTEHPEGRLRDEILRRLDRIEGGSWANRLPAATDFSAPDRRRITEYVGGITRQRRWMDFLIDSFSSRPTSIDDVVRQILRIGIYELVELGRPAHSAVFASVEQTKRLTHPGVSKFVNGLLRSIGRSLDDLPKPSGQDPVANLGVTHSHPDWIVRAWVDRFGVEAATALLMYNNKRPVHSLRVNTLSLDMEAFQRQLDELEVSWEQSPYLPDFVRVEHMQPIVAAGLFDSGTVAVQDESAGLVGKVMDPSAGEFIVDACAAPGGKMIHAAMLMGNIGRIVGVDPNGKRLSQAVEAAVQHGVSIIESKVADLRDLDTTDMGSEADAVLVDAPCSGLGVLSRRADLRWNRTEESIAGLVKLQDELLDAASRLVKSGGRLIYSTCTVMESENRERVEAFLSSHPDFRLESVEGRVPSPLVVDGCMETLPHLHGIDGAFAARLVRS